jgi:hypothetical protein
MAYLPSPGNVNQIVARLNPWRSRIRRTEATRYHGRQERGTKRSVPNQAHLHHLLREPCAHRSRRLSNCLTTHPSPSPWRAPTNTKRGITRDHLQHRRKLSVPAHRDSFTHHPPTLPPHHGDDYTYSTRSIYDDPVLVCYHQYGICTGTCPFPIHHHDLFHPPQKSQLNRGVVKDLAKKDPQEAKVTLSSESDSDSYYSDCFRQCKCTRSNTYQRPHGDTHYAECTLN